jgi:hypothetical protein
MRNYFFALVLLVCGLYVYKTFAQTNKSTDYIIVSANLPANLEKEVALKIKSGYQPIGGIAADGKYLYQAMSK